MAEQFADDLSMDEGVLAHIECHEMKAECVDPSKQPIHREKAGMCTFVCPQAVSDQLDIGLKLAGLFVGICDLVVSGLQPFLHETQIDAIRHFPVPRGHGVVSVLKHVAIVVDLVEQFLVEADALLRLAEFCREARALPVVEVENQRTLTGKRRANRLRIHIRVAVHVTTDPGCEPDHVRHLQLAALVAVNADGSIRNILV